MVYNELRNRFIIYFFGKPGTKWSRHGHKESPYINWRTSYTNI